MSAPRVGQSRQVVLLLWGDYPGPRNAENGRNSDATWTPIATDVGAGAEIRTRTPLRAAEFKSAASAVPPLRREARVVEPRADGLGQARWSTGRLDDRQTTARRRRR